jgi:pimeloyl-ACP methyl ester carboxylesterase
MDVKRIDLDTPVGTIAAWRSGDGAPALLLHGGPGVTDYVDGLARELDGAFDTIRFQQRGLDPTQVREPYTVEAHVEDCVRVLDALAIERAWIVGHSWGGHLALHLAIAHPERVAGLVVIDGLGDSLDVLAEFERNMLRGIDDETAAWLRDVDERAERGDASDEELLESLRILWPNYYADPAKGPPMPAGHRMSSACAGGTWTSIREHAERGTLALGAPGIGVPTLFVHGALDPLPPSAVESIAAAIPGAELVVVPACGHIPWVEAPGAVLNAVRAFVLPGVAAPAHGL